MDDYASTGTDERCGTGQDTDGTNPTSGEASEKGTELQRLVLCRATIRINSVLFDDRRVLEHESAAEH
jgi:hypothetical protein